MRRIVWIIGVVWMMGLWPLSAQDAFNLPTELYVLLNEGRIDRYGLGAEGVQPVTQGGQFAIDFGVSPDGDWIAYRLEAGLVVADVLNGDGQIVDSAAGFPPIRGDGASIAWSPDSRQLAYTADLALRVYFRLPASQQDPYAVDIDGSFQQEGFGALLWSPTGRYLAVRNAVEPVWQIYRVDANLGTVELVSIVPPSADLTWVGADMLLFAPLDGGLVTMDLAQVNTQRVVLRSPNVYTALHINPDGQIQALRRRVDVGGGTVSGQYVQINTQTGALIEEGASPFDITQVRDLRWTPDGAFITGLKAGVLLLINPTDGNGFTIPSGEAVAYGWGRALLPTVDGYAVPSNLFFIARDEDGVAQVWQLFRDATPPTPLTRATADVTAYTLSPDGFTVAYFSGGVLWTQQLNDGSEAQPRYTLNHTAYRLDFSPDGGTLAYDDGTGNVWTADVGGAGEPSIALAYDEALARGFARPRYAPNFGAMLVDILTEESGGTGLLDTTSGELRELFYGYQNAHWLYDGRIMTFAPQGPFYQAGVQITPFNDLDTPQIVLPDSVSVRSAALVPQRRTEDVRVIFDGGEVIGPYPLRVYNFRDGAGLTPLLERGFAASPQLSPDGTTVAGYVQPVRGADGTQWGALTLVDVASGEQVRLSVPAPVRDVWWQR